jgi:hypothetical protein
VFRFREVLFGLDPYHWVTDPDPALFFSWFQDASIIILLQMFLVISSVADPDPNPDPDPRFFGPPGSGSGSTSQRYGSGSDSGSGSGSFYHSKKNLDSSYFVTLFEFFFFENDVNVASKSHKQKKLCKKISFLLAS